jgi:two-component system, OmpR family, response regulator MprA
LEDCLTAEGYRVLTATDGAGGLDRVLKEKPDLILLDVMLPKLDGFALCAELRRLTNVTPVLMLTAKSQVSDRVTGLDAGADDYLVKPFSTHELLARIRALLRRSEQRSQASRHLILGSVRIDLARQTATRGRSQLHLTAREFAMLRLMTEADGQPVEFGQFGGSTSSQTLSRTLSSPTR